MLLRSTRIITPEGTLAGGILIDGERIVEVLELSQLSALDVSSTEVVDVGDHYILPGVIDGHVHVNEPGRTEWEGMEAASKAAAAGGITTIVDMPLNSSPVTISVETLEAKRQAVKSKCWVDVGFHGGAVGPAKGSNQSASTPDRVRGLIEAGIVGLKVFQCDSGLDEFPAITRNELEWLMPILSEHGLPLWSHAELIPSDWIAPDKLNRYVDWPAVRSKDFETSAITELISLARATDCPIHIVHLSNAEALTLTRRAQRAGIQLTVETCPHYLYFAEEHIPDGDPRFKCCPPIRNLQNRHRLWQGLELNEINTIGSDHSPCPPPMKFLDEGDFARAWGGISSLQLLLPLIWDTASRYQVPISRLIECLSLAPAKLLGIDHRKGSIEAGKDADLVVLDPDHEWCVVGKELYHRHKITPYEGINLQGRVTHTFLRGRAIYANGQVIESARGELLTRNRRSARESR